MDRDEEFIKEIFSIYGIELKKIEEDDSKSPDFIYQQDEYKVLLELKTKYDDKKLIDEREKAFENDEIYEHHDILKYNNTYSGINRNAYMQLKEKKEKVSADICLIIFYAKEPNSFDKMEKYEVTIYGKKFLIPLNTNEMDAKYCFYYYLNDFMRFKDIIDGAILTNGKKLRVCMNSASPNYEKLKKCNIVKAFHNAVKDPIKLEKDNKIMILPEKINRKNKAEVNEYIENKYKIKRYIEADFPSITYESILYDKE